MTETIKRPPGQPAAAPSPGPPPGPPPGPWPVTQPVTQPVGGELRGDPWRDARVLADRIDALSRFRRAAGPYLPPERLRPAGTVIERAWQRLALPAELTVVALAGPTGSGKSSLFNALVGRNVSPVGVRRPTTGAPHACVWGELVDATRMLDWLRVPREYWFIRESALDAEDQVGLRGLVLLDLPDFDSVEREHAAEVERLLGLVDLVVWVLDPQKYADQVIHERYLRSFRRHREVTMVALNQADLLTAEDVVRLLDDIHKLLAADGLTGVATMATSAVDLPTGLAQLRAHLAQSVAARRAARRRLAADVDQAVEELVDLVGPPVGADTADRAAFGALADGLAEAAGVPALAAAAEATYQRQAGVVLTPPLLRWLVPRLSPRVPLAPPPPVNAAAARAAAQLAVRTVAARAGDGLPPPWPDAVARASRSGLPGLPDALAVAVAAAASDRDSERPPRWWRLVGGVQWLVAATALVGLSWLLVGGLMRAVALPVTHPSVGPVSAPVLLLVGSLVAGGLAAVLAQPLQQWAARRARTRARRQLRAAVAEVGRDQVVAPVRDVLDAYAEARTALHTAAGL